MKTQAFKTQLRSEVEKICIENKWDFNIDKFRGMAFENWCFDLFNQS
jgi:hypothetical protein